MDTLLTLFGYLAGSAWRVRRFLIVFVLGVTVAAAVISLLVTPIFRASTLLIPNASPQGLGAALGEISSLAGQFGISAGAGEDPSRIFPDILRSRALTKTILESTFRDGAGESGLYLDRFDVDAQSTAERIEKATKIFLEDCSSVILNPKNNSIKIVVYDRDPSIAAAVANAMADELDRVNQAINRSNAREKREFIEGRRASVLEELRAHEEELKSFREANRQIQSSPQLQLEAERLLRRVRIDEEVYLTLTRELELAKIEEVRDVPVINVLDRAIATIGPHAPRKRLIVTVAFLLSTVLGLLVAMIWESRHHMLRGFQAPPPHPKDR